MRSHSCGDLRSDAIDSTVLLSVRAAILVRGDRLGVAEFERKLPESGGRSLPALRSHLPLKCHR